LLSLVAVAVVMVIKTLIHLMDSAVAAVLVVCVQDFFQWPLVL
jgi:hypothetical protein